MQDSTGPGRPNRRAPAGCYWRGGTLWARLKIRGKELRRTLETDDVRLAKKRRATIKAEAIALNRGDARLTFAQVVAEWTIEIPRRVKSAHTVRSYAEGLKSLAPWLAGKFLDEIDARLIKDMIKGRREGGYQDGVDKHGRPVIRKPVSEASIKRGLAGLSSVMNFAIDENYCEDNPVLPRLKRIKERRDPIMLPRDQDIAKVIARAPGLLAAIIEAACVTGCRQAELKTATHGAYDRHAKRLTVIGKGNKLRVIDLVPFDGHKVFEQLPAGIHNAPLFWYGNGKPFCDVKSTFSRMTREIAAADPDFRVFRFHDLRHWHAVAWLRSGRSIYDLQQRLGHSSIKVTEGYCRYLTPEEERRVKTLDATGGTKSGTGGPETGDASI